jgi:hypothetical protein
MTLYHSHEHHANVTTTDKEVEVPRKKKGLRARGVIDSELAEVERDQKRIDADRARLLAARAALDDEGVAPSPRPRRVSQDEVTEYLRLHPGSRSSQVADGMGIKPTTAAKHLSRGGQAGIYRYENGKWWVVEE